MQRANKSFWSLFFGVLPLCVSVTIGLHTPRTQAGVRDTLATVAVVGGCSALAARYLYNYWNIWTIETAVKPHNIAQTNGQQRYTKLYNWMLDTYPTAGSVKRNEKDVIQDLYRECCSTGNIDFSGMNPVRPGDNLDKPTKQGYLIATINGEMDTLQQYMTDLRLLLDYPWNGTESTWAHFLGISEWASIKLAYEDACQQVGVLCQNPAELSAQKDQAIDSAMDQSCSTHWYHLLSCKANYGKASRLWWQLFKRYNRLQAIKDILQKEREKKEESVHLHHHLG